MAQGTRDSLFVVRAVNYQIKRDGSSAILTSGDGISTFGLVCDGLICSIKHYLIGLTTHGKICHLTCNVHACSYLYFLHVIQADKPTQCLLDEMIMNDTERCIVI